MRAWLAVPIKSRCYCSPETHGAAVMTPWVYPLAVPYPGLEKNSLLAAKRQRLPNSWPGQPR